MVSPVKPRIAILGAGFISDYHVRGLTAAGDVAIACLVGRDLARTRARAAEFGIENAATELAAVLADPGIDGVVVATPDGLHRDHAIAALSQGKAVLLQKPMALDTAQCAEIIAASEASGAPLTVSFMHRYFPEVRWLKRLLDEGALGRVHSVRIRNATPGADWADWFYSPENVSGGVVMQLGVHGIDLCAHLFGPIAEVTASLATARPNRRLADGRTVTTALEDNVVASYTLANGALVSHEMSYTEIAGCDRFRLELHADKGTVWLRSERGPAAIYAPEITGQDGWVNPPLADETLGAAHHRHWLDIVRGQARPDDSASAGLASILVAEAIYRAAGAARRVAVAHPTPKEHEVK
ncbi:MAG: Gfo/Idh/MocA family oxidoreductase [Nitratireductor sp.]|uniref:Gfo/Idh/MocA family protein n=1 Tax=Parasphingorhabdus sp. TaxID=2709688 RepID=UPI0032850ED1